MLAAITEHALAFLPYAHFAYATPTLLVGYEEPILSGHPAR